MGEVHCCNTLMRNKLQLAKYSIYYLYSRSVMSLRVIQNLTSLQHWNRSLTFVTTTTPQLHSEECHQKHLNHFTAGLIGCIKKKEDYNSLNIVCIHWPFDSTMCTVFLFARDKNHYNIVVPAPSSGHHASRLGMNYVGWEPIQIV